MALKCSQRDLSIFDFSDISKNFKTNANGKILRVTILHAIFSIYGDMLMYSLNFMIVPIKKMFAESLDHHYDFNVTQNPEKFELIYSTISSLYYLGYLIGGSMSVYLMDSLGRKFATIYVRASLGIFASFCMVLSKFWVSIELFALAQFLCGILAAMKILLYIYLAECSKKTNKGKNTLLFSGLTNLLTFMIPLICMPNIFGNDQRWWCVPGIALLLAIVHLSWGSFFPESPRHLYIGKNQPKSSMDAVIYYHGAEADLEKIRTEYENEKKMTENVKKIRISELFQNPNLRFTFVIVILAAMISTFSLLSIKSLYFQVLYFKLGFSTSNTLILSTVVSIITWPLFFIGSYLIEKIGRRRLFITVCVLTFLETFLTATAQFIVDFYGGSLQGSWSLCPFLASLIIPGLGIMAHLFGMISHSFGGLNMHTILVTDLCPHSARALIIQIVIILNISIMLFIVLTYPLLSAWFGTGYYIPLILLSATVIYKFCRLLPETQGLTVNEIYSKISQQQTNVDDQSLLISTNSISQNIPEYGTIQRKFG